MGSNCSYVVELWSITHYVLIYYPVIYTVAVCVQEIIKKIVGMFLGMTDDGWVVLILLSDSLTLNSHELLVDLKPTFKLP